MKAKSWLIGACMLVSVASAHAVDGCKVLLCLAGNWSAIPICVPDVKKALMDMAKGHGFPTCKEIDHGLGSTSAAHCPPQYLTEVFGESSSYFVCGYTGVINIAMEGAPWAKVWWSMGGDVSTEYTATAKAKLGSFYDTKFDDDYAKWLASLPPPPPPCTGDC